MIGCEDITMERLLTMAVWQRDDLAVKRIRHKEKARRRRRKWELKHASKTTKASVQTGELAEVVVTLDRLNGLTRKQIDNLAFEHAKHLEKNKRQNYVNRDVYHPHWNPTGSKSSREHKAPEPAEEEPPKKQAAREEDNRPSPQKTLRAYEKHS